MTSYMNLLLIEDDEGDIDLIKESINQGAFKVNLIVVHDGEEALKYLRKEGKHKDKVVPDIILLDLNLPRINGLGVLQAVKLDNKLNFIPIIMFSTSEAKEDIARAYHLGANCYITKPSGFANFKKAVLAVEDYWFQTSRLPK